MTPLDDEAAAAWARDQLVALIEIASPSGGEHAVAAHLERVAAGLGHPVARHDVPGCGPNLVIGAPDATLMLTAHMDTVVPTWEWDGRAVVDGPVVRGLGAQDDKGCIVAALLAFELLRADDVDLATLPVSIGLTVDEEEDGTGSIALAELGPPAHVIALEGTELRVCRAEAGTLDCWIEVSGRSNHGSEPEFGDNAVHKAIALASELLALSVFNRSHPEVCDSVAYIQEFVGGSELFVVPDLARLHVVVRFGAVGEAAEAEHELAALCARWDARLELIEAVDPVIAAPDAPLVRALEAAVERVTGHPAEHAAMPSWTDAHSFAERGSTAVVFGPGTLRVAHRPEEHIDVREIVTCARILADVARGSARL